MVAAMSLYKGMKEKSITQKIESEFWKVKRRIFFLVKRYIADFLVGDGASEVVLLIFFIEKVRLSWKLHQGLFQGKITNAIGKLILTRLGQFLPKCINLISLLKLSSRSSVRIWMFMDGFSTF